jgi:FAD-linked oxidoreductase
MEGNTTDSSAMNVWQNRSGAVTAVPKSLAKPASLDELCHIIRTGPAPLRIAGAGHSFTPLVSSAGTVLSLDRFSGLKFAESGELRTRVGAGTRLGPLNTLLHEVGQALPNMGDIDKQSIGGALGTATHGSGITLGAYHTQLQAIQPVDGRGSLREFDRTSHSDAIDAMGVSLGIFGAITEVTLKNIPAYRLRRRRWVAPIREVLDQYEKLMTGSRSVEFFYVPHGECALMLTSDMTQDPATIRPTEDDEAMLTMLGELRTHPSSQPSTRRMLIEQALAQESDQDHVGEWLHVYPSERRTKFNEMEYHIPFEEGANALSEIIDLTERQFPDVYFPIEVRSVAADETWLSPFFRRPTCSIAVHHDIESDPVPFMRAAESIFRQYGGRPYWGKMHNLTAHDLSSLYPRWAEVLEIRREIDPDNRFVSPYIASLLGVDAGN